MLYGQWLGTIQGTNDGYIMLSIDQDRPTIGWLQVYDNGQLTSAIVTLTVNGQNVTGAFNNYFIHGNNARPDITMPNVGHFDGTLTGQTLIGTWRTNINTNGTFNLTRFEGVKEYAADKTMKWRDFRQWILDESKNLSCKIFRGHTKATYVLRTNKGTDWPKRKEKNTDED
jgi:hypothetical protein